MTLYASMVVGLALSIAVSVFNTRTLGVDEFGDYKLLQNMFSLAITSLTFGAFASGARLLPSQTSAEAKRQLYGAIAVAILLLYGLLVASFLLFSFVQGDLFGRDLGSTIRLILPLLIAYPLQSCLENILKGDNRITSLAVLRFLPSLLYLISGMFMLAVGGATLDVLIALNIASTLVVGGTIFLRLRPSLEGIYASLEGLLREIRRYGLHVYVGILAGVMTTHLGGVMVGYYQGVANAGFFLLAQTMTLPLTFLASTIGAVFYKKFASSIAISRRSFIVVFGLGFGCLIIYNLLIGYVIGWLYPPEFVVIVPLVQLMAIGAVAHGMGAFINNFTCARGYGSYARKAAFFRGAVNLAGYVGLVALVGVQGAAWTALAAGCTALGAEYYYYHKIISR